MDSSTPYVYDLRTRTYVQPKYSFQLLTRILKVNEGLLKSLQTSKDFHTEGGSKLPAGSPIADLFSIGIRDPSVAPSVVSAVFAELGEQTTYVVYLHKTSLNNT